MSAQQISRAIMIAHNNFFAIAGILRQDCDVVENFLLCEMRADGLFWPIAVFEEIATAVNDFNIFTSNQERIEIIF